MWNLEMFKMVVVSDFQDDWITLVNDTTRLALYDFLVVVESREN